MKYCFNCGSNSGIEGHHIFFGTGNRNEADKFGLVVDLCQDCHRGQPNGVHGGNRALDIQLKKMAQWHFEKQHPELNFMKIFGRNYL